MTVSDAEFSAAMAPLWPGGGVPFIAAAVSGGGDSMALCLLLDGWARARGGRVVALTVDHGLRAGSAAEARAAGALLSARGIGHEILAWTGAKPSSGVQEEARRARYALLLDACRSRGCGFLALAHNAEDQAETFWMRLAAGSGLDGLAAMAPRRDAGGGVVLLRPLLPFTRAQLRGLCRERGMPWAEDPSNTDERFLRPRLRGFENLLAAEGLTPARLARTAQKLSDAAAALEEISVQAFAACVTRFPAGHARIDLPALRAAPREIRLRVLSSALRDVYPQDYPPRRDALLALDAALGENNFSGRTLAGCAVFAQGQDGIVVCREAARAAPACPAQEGRVWDRRFIVEAGGEGMEIGALGAAGLRLLRAAGEEGGGALPFPVKQALPALWRGGTLVAVPHLGWSAPEAAMARLRRA